MALFGKKGKKSGKKAAKKAKSENLDASYYGSAKTSVSPDIYTLFLGLSALFLITATLVLGLNYYWYQMTEPTVLPMNTWAR